VILLGWFGRYHSVRPSHRALARHRERATWSSIFEVQ